MRELFSGYTRCKSCEAFSNGRVKKCLNCNSHIKLNKKYTGYHMEILGDISIILR